MASASGSPQTGSQLVEPQEVHDPDSFVNAEIHLEEGTATEAQRRMVADARKRHDEDARRHNVRGATERLAAGQATWLDRGVLAHYRPTRGLGRVPCEARTRLGRSREARGRTARTRGSRRGAARSSRAGPSDLDPDDDDPTLGRVSVGAAA